MSIPGDMVEAVRIAGDGTEFSALYALERWAKSNDLVLGSLQGRDPIGLVHRSHAHRWVAPIPKWRGISSRSRRWLDGVVTWEGRPSEPDAVAVVSLREELLGDLVPIGEGR